MTGSALCFSARDYLRQTYEVNFSTEEYGSVDVTLDLQRILQRAGNMEETGL